MTDAELHARIEAGLRKEPRPPTIAEVRNRNIALVVVALAVAIATFEWWGGIRELSGKTPPDLASMHASGFAYPRPIWLMASTFAGTLAVTLLAWRVILVRSRDALGPPRTQLLAGLLLAPLSLFVWRVGWSAFWEGGLVWVDTRPGLRCFGLSLLLASPVLLALMFGRRGSDPVHPGWTGAMIGMTSGATAALFADLWCPVGNPVHVLAGHILPMVLFALVGAVAGRRILDLR